MECKDCICKDCFKRTTTCPCDCKTTKYPVIECEDWELNVSAIFVQAYEEWRKENDA